ncbi:hypothetical protein CDD81_2385 [Ophiocordyceps australis]|uniref:Uncharacterized protein n=1 Tax=Ophiocordyceps australis TaxID=1399860 RepID=A0A2C5XTX5_9HYPO|nr:hypothetical protein CDD81_2385 [Ophiocordyceps australis]
MQLLALSTTLVACLVTTTTATPSKEKGIPLEFPVGISTGTWPAPPAAKARSQPPRFLPGIKYVHVDNYTVGVFSFDCPCRRVFDRYCTAFWRPALEGQCYTVSHYVKSMSVSDALVGEHNRLGCRVWPTMDCQGVSLELSFTDNTGCRDPSLVGDFEYRSFACWHYS